MCLRAGAEVELQRQCERREGFRSGKGGASLSVLLFTPPNEQESVLCQEGIEVIYLALRPLPMQTRPICLQPLPPTFSGRYKRILHLLSGFGSLAHVSDLVGVWMWMIGTGLGVGVVGLGLSEHLPRTHVELAGGAFVFGFECSCVLPGPGR